MGPKSKNEFFRGQSPITVSPILPQFFTLVMHFQWEGLNTTVDQLSQCLSSFENSIFDDDAIT